MANLPVPTHAPAWPLLRDPSKRGAGEGWQVTCEACGYQGPTSPGGTCRGCQAALMPALPPVSLPPSLRTRLHSELAAPGFFSILLSRLGKTAILLTVLALNPVLGLILMFAMQRSEPRSQAGGTDSNAASVWVQKVWFDVTSLRGRRGLVLQYDLTFFRLMRRKIDVAVRFRGPDGTYLPGLLQRYTGDAGETLIRHVTRPLKTQSSQFPRMWLFVPLRALAFPSAATHVALTVETVFSCDGAWLAENRSVARFTPLPGDSVLEAPAAASRAALDDGLDPGAVRLLSAETDASGLCGVCGDSLAGEPTSSCDRCGAAHHTECWEYFEGCSTYACEG